MWRKGAAAQAAAILFVVLSATPAFAQAAAPAEAFAALPERAPGISPDGKYFAVMRGINGRPAVAIYKVDAPADAPLLFTSDDWIIDGIRWVKNDVLIVYNKKNTSLGTRSNTNMLRELDDAVAIYVQERRQQRLSAYMEIQDVDLSDPDVIYASISGSLYSWNVRSAHRPVLFKSGLNGAETDGTSEWYLDGHGNVLARMDSSREFHPEDQIWHMTLKTYKNGSWEDLAHFDATVDSGDGVGGLAEDGGSFLRIARRGSLTDSVAQIDAETGAEKELYSNPVYDAGPLLSDAWTGRIIGYVIDEDLPSYHYFDPKRQALQKGLEQAFPGLSVHAVSMDVSQQKVIAEVQGPQMPPSYYLINRVTHQAVPIAASNPDLDPKSLGQVKPYPYAARDGLEIHAYLTLPPGIPAKNLPLVVMPHGGPDARDDMSFDWWAQFLATRGYAVLKPNFRGSSGYGRTFTEAGFHQWGLKMQDDVTDGVKKAIADGIADPKRVCIVGASYGGYAALAGAVFTPDLYHCVVSYAGIGNLPAIMGWDKMQGRSGITNNSFTVTRIGDAFRDVDRLNATSPALHADQAQAPILLLHSESDVTVPIVQSEAMETALKKAGKHVEFVRLPGDDHYLSLQETRLRLLQECERFLKANIGS